MRFLIPVIVFQLLFFAFGTVNGQKDEILLEIGKTEITRAEFERIYRKNNQSLPNESDVKSPEDYLELFIDFKLKVTEAVNLKMDTADAFIQELAGYRKELAEPYLTDISYDEKLVYDLYTRMKTEVNASHILFSLPENAASEQEQEVLDKVNRVRDEIMNGLDFNEAAAKYSDDPSAKSNQGNLGYFSAFQMVVPFENAAFTTPKGKVSEPVRSSFGYHLLKVHNIRENMGEIQVSHIMKMFPQGAADFDKSSLKNEIDSLYQALLGGADFAELARKYSDDKRSAVKGGEMPWFTSGQMIPEFAVPAFALKYVGDISEPVETAFGYHIIKKTGERKVAEFENVRPQIEARIKQDPLRRNSSEKAFLEKLKAEYNFRINKDNVDRINTFEVNGKDVENPVLFSFAENDFYLNDFDKYLKSENITAGNYSSFFDDWVNYELTEYENRHLEDKYPDFRFLMQEYFDGLLLFEIMEEKIWKFAVEDSTGLEKFYSENRDMFSWDERFKGVIVKCDSRDTKSEVDKYLEAGIPADELNDLIESSDGKIEIESGAWEEGTNSIVDYFIWNGPETGEFDVELVSLKGDLISAEPKSFEEAKGMYISEYQNYLEKEWLKELRKKYKVKVNKKVLNSIPHV